MEKEIVNEDKYLELLNQQLRQHPSYQKGMEIIGVPEGTQGSNLSGYDWRGPDYMPDIVSQVAHKVEQNYVVVRSEKKRTESTHDF